MSHPEDAEPLEELDGEDAQLLVADPDDYHEAQRLREIHEARRDVRTTLRNADRYTTPGEHSTQKLQLADAVTAYITELEPLMEATDWDDSLNNAPWATVRQYATVMGRRLTEDGKDDGIASYEESMMIFRHANRFLADVKPLVTEEDTNEWEI